MMMFFFKYKLGPVRNPHTLICTGQRYVTLPCKIFYIAWIVLIVNMLKCSLLLLLSLIHW